MSLADVSLLAFGIPSVDDIDTKTLLHVVVYSTETPKSKDMQFLQGSTPNLPYINPKAL